MNLSNFCIHCGEATAEGYAPTYYIGKPNRLCRYCRTLVETEKLQTPDNTVIEHLVVLANHYCLYRLELYLRADYGFGTFEQFSEGLFSPVYLTPLSRVEATKSVKGYKYQLADVDLTYYVISGFYVYLEKCYAEMIESFPSAGLSQ